MEEVDDHEGFSPPFWHPSINGDESTTVGQHFGLAS